MAGLQVLGRLGAWLPLLARCLIVSICSPDSFAFFMADVALGHPDKLQTRKKMTLTPGFCRAGGPQSDRQCT
jgi:hypothetical protein